MFQVHPVCFYVLDWLKHLFNVFIVYLSKHITKNSSGKNFSQQGAECMGKHVVLSGLFEELFRVRTYNQQGQVQRLCLQIDSTS